MGIISVGWALPTLPLPQDLSLVQDDRDTILTTNETTIARLLNVESDQIGESSLIFSNSN